MHTHMHWENKYNEKVNSRYVKVTNQLSLKVIFKMWIYIQEKSRQSTAPNTNRAISCKACNTTLKYISSEYEFYITESNVDMLNLIL